MSLCKEVILSYFVMMHIFFIATQPIGPVELRRNLKHIVLPLCTLHAAEEDYIKMMFGGQSPKGLEPLEGITWPAGNTKEEIQTSICAITDYLENHIPAIIRSITVDHNHGATIIKKITAFLAQFKVKVSSGQNNIIFTKHCHRNVTTASDYEKKKTGLQIIYFTRQWVEHFANITCRFS